ncbi:M15 family metallopeptidase [Alteromonas ponticola]|uniref:M15 family metallopeptidase n=1 Tax=Alteromonas aquimaris TaxID=2998417 RepID=A0ABT3P7Q4_9ALTE|nr:M15 family metallopeptidase [Alteromonas aquimaris]MCW8108801.1 M15 family metallopeptidase [Alteromonas aquimaris]
MISNEEWLGISHSQLIPLDERHQLHHAVITPFKTMQIAAKSDGIDCQLVSSYRSFERQLSIWNRKWAGETTLYDARGNRLNHTELTADEKIEAILSWSALPGGSRHHWGTDFDVYDRHGVENRNWNFELIVPEYEQNGPCYELACWLNENAGKYGFIRPFKQYTGGVAKEPWHLSHSPTASRYEEARNIHALKKVLTESDISGKDAILIRLEELYDRYVLNRGKL